MKVFQFTPAHTDCDFTCLQYPQRDFKPFKTPATGSAAAQPQGPHGLWLVNIKHSNILQFIIWC